MTAWAVVLGVGAASFAFRFAPLLLRTDLLTTPRATAVLDAATTAALVALVVGGLRRDGGSAPVATAAAAVVAAVAARAGRNTAVVTAGGLGTYWAVALLSGMLA